MFCPSCGAKNPVGVDVCVDCRRALPANAASSSPAPAPPEPPSILRRSRPLAPPPSLATVPRAAPRAADTPVASPTPPASPAPRSPALAPAQPASARDTTTTASERAEPSAALSSLPRTMPPLGARQVLAAEVSEPQIPSPRAVPAPVTLAPVHSAEPSDEATPVARPRPRTPPPRLSPAPTAASASGSAAPGSAAAGSAAAGSAAAGSAAAGSAAAGSAAAGSAAAGSAAAGSAALPRAPRAPLAAPGGARLVLDVAPAPRQWAAAAVDALLLVGVEAAAVRGALGLLEVRPTLQAITDVVHGSPTRLLPVVVLAVVTLLAGRLAPLLLGASPGQRLVGLRLVDAGGAVPSRARLAVRAVVDTLGTLVFLSGPAFALFLDRHRRGPGDVVAGTVAVRR